MLLWQLIFIQVVTFGLLLFLLRHLFYRQVTQARDRLDHLYQQNLTREEDLKKSKDDAEKKLKIEMARYQEEMKKLKADAESEIQKMSEEVLTQAREEGERVIAEAKNKGDRLKARFMAEAEEKAVGLTEEILKHLFSSKIVEGIHHHLIDGLIEEIGKLDGQRIKKNIERAEVKVPQSLTAAQKGSLTQVLSTKTGKLVDIKEFIDPDIMAGMVIRLDELILDGGLNNKLKETLAHVRETLSQ